MKPSSTLFKLFTAFIVLALVTSACSGSTEDGPTSQRDDAPTDGSSGSTPGSGETPSGNRGVSVSIDGPGSGSAETDVIITLDEAPTGSDPAPDRETTVDGDPLDAADSDALLQRLPDLVAVETDQVEFNRPADTRLPPRPDTTLESAFPPAGDSTASRPRQEPLEILRYQPEGPVDLAPFISVTFNQPMVALSTVDQVEANDIPISVTPEMPGRWIWLGTRTVRFEYERNAIDRIPAATTYTVEIEAGTSSASGAELEDDVRFEFSTPTVEATRVTPMHDSLALEPLFFISFNQRINPTAVLGAVDLRAGDGNVAIRLATGDEINEDTTVADLVEQAAPDRWMVVRPVNRLPSDASVSLTVGPEVPSAEGPETSRETFTFTGRTYGPLRIIDSQCGWGDCQPGSPLSIQMSNPLDTEAFSAEQITVEPEIQGMQVGVNGPSITITGLTRGRTDYDVTIGPDLVDVFGQEHGGDDRVTFRVGDAFPALFPPGRSLVTLDPVIDDQRLNVTSINNDELVMTVYEVDPERDWQAFNDNRGQVARGQFRPSWPILSERTITPDGDANSFVETAVDLGAELSETGHVVVVMGPARLNDDEWRNHPFAVWVQSTRLGLDATTDHQDAIAWVTDLTTGEPIDGATVTLIGGRSGTTDVDGVARIALPGRATGMIAISGDDRALIGDFWGSRWEHPDRVAWYVINDRGLYKPGETAYLKGFVRRVDADVPAELSLPREGGEIQWLARDGFGNEIGSGETTLTSLGGFDIKIDIPTDITLGSASVEFSTDAFPGSENSGSWHELRVQEFRRPDFEVTAEVAEQGPHLAGEPFTVAAAANYFSGGSLAGSEVEWNVNGSATSYSPPKWPDFTFGVWVPWWFGFDDFSVSEFDSGFGGGFDSGFGGGTTEFFMSRTDAGGEHGLSIVVATEGKPRPVAVRATATVIDVSRQTISGSANALVHPADLYVGLRGGRTFVQPGERLDLDVIVTDIDGQATAGVPVSVLSERLEWQFVDGAWQEVAVPDEECEITSTDQPTVCTFRPSEGGRHRISARVTDAQGRENLTELTRWVAGGTRPTNRRVELEDLTLVPNAETFEPGETAEILVQSPFVDAHGLLIISRGTIDRTEPIDFDSNGTAVVTVPITESDIPGIGVQFEVVGTAPRLSDGQPDESLPVRPAFAAGRLTLTVPASPRELTVEVAPRQDRLEPGAQTKIDVAVTDSDGEPVANAELAVIVVDEAVLSLTNYQLTNPLDTFYSRGYSGVQAQRGRATLLLSDPLIADGGDDTAADAVDDSAEEAGFVATAAEGEDEDDSGRLAAPAASLADQGEDQSIELRTNFDALAVFEPEVTTDSAGRATVDVPVPDNLTRYRVMVVATADATDAGSGESNLTARLPVTVRPKPPRFANFGDTFAFPVIVQNATDDDLEVDVALRSTNLTVTGREGTTVTVPANDRIEVRFDVAVAEAGTARYQVAASSGSFADAADGEFEVYTPATAEAFATYGVVDSGSIAQPFQEPQEVFPQFGGLEISTSSTAVAALTDALIYVGEYRYEHSDAFASRIMAIVSLDDILEAFEAEQLPSPDELRSVMNSDIARLSGLQNPDGGFPYWRRGWESIPYNTVQSTHALVLADKNGYAVDEQVLLNALWYLANIEDHYPSWYGPNTREMISAYALHVRYLSGDRDIDKATALYSQAGDDIELDVAAWLWPLLADTPIDGEIERLLNNRVTETPNQATFATSYSDQAWVLLHSDRRTDAIVLDALVSQRPASDLVLKTLNGLMASRGRRGHWTNIQENSFVLLAGAAYFATFEDAEPDFVARAWLGETYAVEHVYEGRSTERNLTVVPMAELVEQGDTDIVLARDGEAGRLYYRFGLRYAPTDLKLEPRDQGFVVHRTYEAVDDESEVVRNDDGTWTVQAGARVRVRVTMVADSRRTHVALIDPIPAGFEIINPALATAEPVPQIDPTESEYSGFWWYRWFNHQNLRDDRAEAFTTWLGAGSYEYTYVARATTPGEFVTPPARAEQIYEPEVFGRSSTTFVTITD